MFVCDTIKLLNEKKKMRHKKTRNSEDMGSDREDEIEERSRKPIERYQGKDDTNNIHAKNLPRNISNRMI